MSTLHDRLLQYAQVIQEVRVLAREGERWEPIGAVSLPDVPPREKGEEDDIFLNRVQIAWEQAAPMMVREAEDMGRDAGSGVLRVQLVGEGRRILATIGLVVLGVAPAKEDTLPKEWPADPLAQMAYVHTFTMRQILAGGALHQGHAAMLFNELRETLLQNRALVDRLIPLHEAQAAADALSEVDEGEGWAGALTAGLEFVTDLRRDAKAKSKGPLKGSEVPGLLLRLAQKVPKEERAATLKAIEDSLPALMLELKKE